MSVTCKCWNLFFPCFYGWLVTVLCRYGKFIFPCLYVWQVLLSDVVKDTGTSNVWEFIFPVCSIGIYFSSALERVYFSLFMCGNLFFPVCSLGIYFSSALVRLCYLSDPLLHVSDKCNTSTAEAVIGDYVRYSCMHISDIYLVILSC